MSETLAFKILLLCLIGAFWPLIMRGLHRLGFRKEGEVNTTGWKRGVMVIGLAVFLTAFALIW